MAGGEDVEISILGDLRVGVSGHDRTEALPAQLRPLLVALAIATEPVPKHQLARDVLFLSPASIDSRLSRLRTALGLGRPLHRTAPPRSGRIELDRSVARVDADEYRARARFDEEIARDPRTRLADLVRADDLWHGPPVACHDLGDPEGRTAVGRGRSEILDARERGVMAAVRLALRHRLPIEDRRLVAWTRERPDIPALWFGRVVLTLDRLGPDAADAVLEEWAATAPGATPDRSMFEWARLVVRSGAVRPNGTRPLPEHEQVPIGRETGAARLESVLDAVTAGESRVAVIEGAAGVGKSRLIAYVTGRAVARGIRIAPADVEERAGLADVLQAALRPVWDEVIRDPEPSPFLLRRAAALSTLFGIEPSTRGEVREPADPVELLSDLAHELLRLAARREPILLILDNVHCAHPELDRLVRRLLAARIAGFGIVVSSRQPFLEPPTRDDDTRVRLGDLDRSSAARFLRQVRGRTLDDDAMTTLADRVGTTPLALLTTDLDQIPDSRSSTEESMREVLLTRDADTRRALTLAAVAAYGTVCDDQLLRALAGRDRISPHLVAEATRGEIVSNAADGIAFTHRAWQELAYRAIDPSERRRLHGLAVQHLGQRIANTAQSRADVLRVPANLLAFHARGCGRTMIDRIGAVQLLTRAADLVAPLDIQGAIDLYGCAIDALHDSPLIADLHLRRARLRWLAADWSGARSDLQRARREADVAGDVVASCEALLLTAHLTWDPSSAALLADDLTRMLERLPADERLLRARVEACLAGGLYQDGATGAAHDAPALARAALRTLADLPTPPEPAVEAELLWWCRKGLLDIDPPGANAELSRRMQDVAGGSEHHLGNALLAGIVDDLVLGRARRARTQCNRYSALAETTGAPLHRYTNATLTGLWALYDGRFDDVVVATDLAREAGAFGGVTSTQVIEGQRVCLARDQGAFRAQPELVALVEALTPVDGPIPIWSAAGAWLSAEIGDDAGALERLEHIAGITRELTAIPHGPHRLPLLAFVAETLAELRWHLREDVPSTVARLGARVSTALEHHPGTGVLLGWPVVYLGSKHRFLGLAASAAGRADDAIQHFRAARQADGTRTPVGVRDALGIARLQYQLGLRPDARRAARACLLRATELRMIGVADDTRSLLQLLT